MLFTFDDLLPSSVKEERVYLVVCNIITAKQVYYTHTADITGHDTFSLCRFTCTLLYNYYVSANNNKN